MAPRPLPPSSGGVGFRAGISWVGGDGSAGKELALPWRRTLCFACFPRASCRQCDFESSCPQTFSVCSLYEISYFVLQRKLSGRGLDLPASTPIFRVQIRIRIMDRW